MTNDGVIVVRRVDEPCEDYLAHYGILGMKWGIRRYQNPDGTYTDEGRKRYGIGGNDSGFKDKIRFVIRTNKKTSEEKAAEKVEKKKLSEEEYRVKVLRSGNAAYILKNQKKLTKQELSEALQRARDVRQLMEMAKQDAENAKAERKKNSKLGKTIAALNRIMETTNNTLEKANKLSEAFKKAKKWLNDEEDSKVSAVYNMPLEDLIENYHSFKNKEQFEAATSRLSKEAAIKKSISALKGETTTTPAPAPTATTTREEAREETRETTSPSGDSDGSSFRTSSAKSDLGGAYTKYYTYGTKEREKDAAAERLKALFDKSEPPSASDATAGERIVRRAFSSLDDDELYDLGW